MPVPNCGGSGGGGGGTYPPLPANTTSPGCVGLYEFSWCDELPDGGKEYDG